MCARWNISPAQLNRLQASGKIQEWKDNTVKKSAPASKTKPKVPKPTPAGILHICGVLRSEGIAYRTEYKFHDTRKFKFDIALPDRMIAIEYEGLVATGKKGGHQTKKHYTKDCDKYNLATSLGWKIYRYTALNYKEFSKELISSSR